MARRLDLALRLSAAIATVSSMMVGAPREEPDIPTGSPYGPHPTRPRDERGRLPACSFLQPICVHATRATSAETILGVLADAERATTYLVDALGLPRPLFDGRLGGSPAFDIYLVGPDALGPVAVKAESDPAEPASFDRASSFALLRDDFSPGCARQNLVARVIGSAIGLRIDPAEGAGVRESNAAYWAELVAPCGVVTSSLVDAFQSHPERALFDSSASEPGSSMPVPWFLDLALGAWPGRIPAALAMIAGQRTEPGSLLWNNEPDLYDALRNSLRARTPPIGVDDLLLELAITRLFMGARDDGAHLTEAAFAGTFGQVRFDWSIPFGSLPRRVSPERPIDPTGSAYLWIDMAGAPRGARLAFRMEWEAPVPFRWALVRVARDGSEASRLLVTARQKATSAEVNLEVLDDLAGVAVVAVNVGDLGLDDPFDPDATPYEPHGYVVTVARAP